MRCRIGIRGQQRHKVAARGMTHDDQLVRIGAPASGLLVDPDRQAQVFGLFGRAGTAATRAC